MNNHDPLTNRDMEAEAALLLRISERLSFTGGCLMTDRPDLVDWPEGLCWTMDNAPLIEGIHDLLLGLYANTESGRQYIACNSHPSTMQP